MLMDINYALYAFHVKNLGPGDRSVLWVQGCPFDCKGCIAPSHRGVGGKHIDSSKLAQIFLDESDSGEITISGGEPTMQAKALVEFVSALKDKREIGVILYSGFSHEDLCKRAEKESDLKALLSRVDLLIDGNYVENRDKGELLRGSDNQNYIFLTEKYRYLLDDDYINKRRQIEIRFENNEMNMIGIPSKAQAKSWEAAKKTLIKINDKG